MVRIINIKKRVLYFIVFLFTAFFSLLFIGFHFIAPYYGILKPNRISCVPNFERYPLAHEILNLETSDSIVLHGYKVDAPSPSKATLILVHGISGCSAGMLPLANTLAKNGYNSITFDNRAHGKSGGEYCTYGYYEKRDIKEVVDYLLRENETQTVGIWGNSLGGAIAIQALEYDERIQFGVIESTFSDLRKIIFDYKKRIFGIGNLWLTNYAIDRAGKIANFKPDEVYPLESVQHIEQPVLIAHGDQDENIAVEYGKLLYENLASEDKKLIIVENGKHIGLAETAGLEYTASLIAFIDKHTLK